MKIDGRRAAITRIGLVGLIVLLVIGLGLGLGSLYAINGISAKSNLSSTVSTTPLLPPPSSSSSTATAGNASLAVSCSPAPISVGAKTSCTATLGLLGRSPSGSVYWKSNETGGFSVSKCAPSSGSCSVVFRPSSRGTANITGEYLNNKNESLFGAYYLDVGQAASQTFLSCSSVSTIGTPSKCTASVYGFGTPTGNVSFSATGLGTFDKASCTLNRGACFVNFTPLTVSSIGQNLTATYPGDSNNNASSSTPYQLTVGAVSSSTTINCSPSTLTVGSGPTSCTVAVAGYNPTGSVALTSTDSGAIFSPSPQCTLVSNTTTSCTVSYTPSVVGNATIEAKYSGDSNNTATFGIFVVNVGITVSSLKVSCSPSSVSVGVKTSCVSTVVGNHPTGTISWQATGGTGTFDQTTCTLYSSSSCTVQFTPNSIAPSITITAYYSGDTNNSAGSSSFSIQSGAATSSTTVTCSPSTVSLGVSASCTATVTGYQPTGSITWSSLPSNAGSFSSPTCQISSGSSSCSVNYTPSTAGSVTITAQYSGDPNNKVSSGQFNLAVGQSASTVSLNCSPNPVAIGSSASCSASVSGTSPSGTVTFSSPDAGSSFSPRSGKCTLSSSACQVFYSPSVAGPETLTATYSGDTNNAPSSSTFALTVSGTTSATSVSCNSVSIGSSTTCTITVSGYFPTGSVAISSTDRGAVFNPNCTLSSGSCQISYTPSSAGPATITATYSGDSNNNPSTGKTSGFRVGQFLPSISVSCSSAGGNSYSCTVTVNGYNPTGTVSWSTSGNGIFSSSSCNLQLGQCTVTYTSNDAPGTVVTITADYLGDVNNQQNSGMYSLLIF